MDGKLMRAFLLLAFLLCAPAQAQMLQAITHAPASTGAPVTSTFALVAHATSAAFQSGSATTSAIDTSTANLCIVKQSWAVSASPATCAGNLSDSKSNTWKTGGPVPGSSATTGDAICYASPCTTGTGHTFTFSGTNLYGSIQVAAFKGAASPITVQFYENNGSNSIGVSIPAIQPGPVGTLRPYMLSVTGVTSTQTGTWTIDQGFTITDQKPWDSTNGGGGALAYKIQSAANKDSPTWTGGTSGIMSASQVVFNSTTPVQPPGTFTQGPCDVMTGGCQEAWSLTRRMRAAYSGPLFRLGHIGDAATLDVGTIGGIVDLSTWSTFCSGGIAYNCFIITIYAQVNSANNLHFSTLSNAGDNARPNCAASAHACASPLAFGFTSGLPEITLDVAYGPPRLAYEYLIGSDGTDGNSVGIASGGASRTLVEIGQFQPGVNACCGHFGPTAHQLGATGSSFLIALGYGDPGPGVLECIANTYYCATVDCEAGAGCNAATFPPAPTYSTTLPSNTSMVVAKFDSASRVTSMSFNATPYYSVTSNPGYMATGTHFALGGGGDFTTPSPFRWWEGFIAGAVATQADENALIANARAFYKMATFP